MRRDIRNKARAVRLRYNIEVSSLRRVPRENRCRIFEMYIQTELFGRGASKKMKMLQTLFLPYDINLFQFPSNVRSRHTEKVLREAQARKKNN